MGSNPPSEALPLFFMEKLFIITNIIYLGFVEVIKIGKLLRKKLDAEFDISRKWASQAYSILKKRQAERKVAGV